MNFIAGLTIGSCPRSKILASCCFGKPYAHFHMCAGLTMWLSTLTSTYTKLLYHFIVALFNRSFRVLGHLYATRGTLDIIHFIRSETCREWEDVYKESCSFSVTEVGKLPPVKHHTPWYP